MRTIIASVMIVVVAGHADAAAKIIHAQRFGDWTVEVHQDDWGDEKSVTLREANGNSIYMNSKFGFVMQRYTFEGLRDTWPYCGVTDLAYRIDGGEPVRTGMGGEAARGPSCASIHMPGYMLKDMKKGKVMELRAGAAGVKISVSLDGFSEAWRHAVSHMEAPPRVDTWMTPN